MTTYRNQDVPLCPHCNKTLEDPAEDFTIPMKTGNASKATIDCGWCNELVQAVRLGPDSIEITAV